MPAEAAHKVEKDFGIVRIKKAHFFKCSDKNGAFYLQKV
ncbi:hypothetical protein LEP1GSC016_0388 [Leptospira borgpetersenii serovar Hardjo-bovis str. Sponselee]|uniref:Uncharacterized protein n=1 Tax=Leptospira borgpetersenii serovar Hardjo-bovis str. Sponselee TaxID=1303729 RepID=M6BPX4_LEPBO|nr:hypothetical protein LEP1GSC016_0388 [Leptospira borgpetersenii serovar Hardjo-bovis str. Sponselee]